MSQNKIDKGKLIHKFHQLQKKLHTQKDSITGQVLGQFKKLKEAIRGKGKPKL